jgi:hypothetical protein
MGALVLARSKATNFPFCSVEFDLHQSFLHDNFQTRSVMGLLRIDATCRNGAIDG